MKELLVCPYCDSVYLRPQNINASHCLYCRVCSAHLTDGRADFRAAFIYAITALILFVIANSFPFIVLVLQGEITTISIFSAVKALYDNNLHLLSVMVFLFVIFMPLYYLCAILWIIISFRFKFFHRFSRKFLHLLHYISPWNMLEVYLAGVAVTLVKIMSMAMVKFENGFWAFVILMFFSILTNSSFNINDAIFQSYEKR